MINEAEGLTCWDQPTFSYLLAVEAARARREGRSFLMLVADVPGEVRFEGRRRSGTAPDLATALARALREADLVGWHRAGRAAGAILTHGPADLEAAQWVGSAVLQRLQAVLPAEIARRLRVRVYRHGLPDVAAGFERIFAAGGDANAMAPMDADADAPGATWLAGRTVDADAPGATWLAGRTVSPREGT